MEYNLNENTLEEELKYTGDFIKVVRTKVTLPDGREGHRDIVRHPGAVAIVAIKDDGKILVVEQFRKPVEKELLEIPAGKLNKGEDPLEAAKRELKEETGYSCEDIQYLGKIATAPGFCDEYISIYKATGLTKGNTEFDEDEFINLKEFSLKDLKIMIREGKIEDGKTIASLQFL
jgi:ADP-ribose pyrophosphatase